MLYQFNTSIKHYSIVSRTRTEISFIDCLILIAWLSILTPKKQKIELQPHPCDANCNSCIYYMHSGDHYDVHLVYARSYLPP